MSGAIGNKSTGNRKSKPVQEFAQEEQVEVSQKGSCATAKVKKNANHERGQFCWRLCAEDALNMDVIGNFIGNFTFCNFFSFFSFTFQCIPIDRLSLCLF